MYLHMNNLLKKLLILSVFVGSTGFSLSVDSIPSLNPVRSKTVGSTNRLSSAYAPTFSNCPSDINNVMPNSGDCTAVVTWTPPTATGSGTVTMNSNYNPGDSFYPGTHRVIYMATDNCPAGEGAPIDQNFDSGADPSSECYDFDGTFVGTDGRINGSAGEIETVELIRNDIRSFTSPLTRFNGTGEIFFDHRILSGDLSGVLGTNSRLTVKLITPGGTETVILDEPYIDQDVRTEYIDVTQSGNYFVQFEWETDQNRGDIAYLDDLYIPGYVVSDVTVVSCTPAFQRVAQISGQPYRSGAEFPVGTTTLEYITRDAAGNVGFNSFKVTVTNNIDPPTGDDVEYCEGLSLIHISEPTRRTPI